MPRGGLKKGLNRTVWREAYDKLESCGWNVETALSRSPWAGKDYLNEIAFRHCVHSCARIKEFIDGGLKETNAENPE